MIKILDTEARGTFSISKLRIDARIVMRPKDNRSFAFKPSQMLPYASFPLDGYNLYPFPVINFECEVLRVFSEF